MSQIENERETEEDRDRARDRESERVRDIQTWKIVIVITERKRGEQKSRRK